VPTFIRPLCFSPSIGLDDGVKKNKCNTLSPNTLFSLNILYIYLFIYLYLYIFVPSHKYVSKYRIPTWGRGGGGIRLVHRINLPSGMGKGHSKNVVKTCTLWPFP